MRNFKLATALLFLLGCLPFFVEAQHFFQDTTTIEITIRSDFKKFRKEKYKGENQKAQLIYVNEKGDSTTKDIKIEARGNFRKSYCYYPPIKLNFKKADFKDPEVDRIKKVKLVGACKNGKSFQQYVFKEYLAYKMLNMLTDKSFGVRMMKINYVDTNPKTKKPNHTEYAFMIEDDKWVAERNDCIKIEVKNVHPLRTNKEQSNIIAVFNYMIGNTDWSIPGLHNVKLIKSNDFSVMEPYVVPYDFDYTGLVNTPYAIPHQDLGIESVRERLFRGFCYEEEEFVKTFEVFAKNKQNILSLIEGYNRLQKSHKREMIDYIDSFYAIIEEPSLYRQRIVKACRTN